MYCQQDQFRSTIIAVERVVAVSLSLSQCCTASSVSFWVRPIVDVEMKLELFLGLLTALLGAASSDDLSDDNYDTPQQRATIQHILSTKNLTDRPHPRMGPIKVDIRLVISRLDQVDEVGQTVKLHGWLIMNWTNPQINWPHAGTKYVRLPTSKIWTPDLTLRNRAESKDYQILSSGAYVKAYRNGTVFYEPPFSVEATCDFDFLEYPWDTQSCMLLFGSASLSNSELRWVLSKTAADTVSIMGSTEKPLANANWELVERETVANLTKSDVDFYGDTEFVAVFLQLKRKADGFAWSYIVLPFMVISFLNLISFWIPRCGRLNMLLFNLILQMIQGCFLATHSPPVTTHEPRITKFTEINFILTSLIILLNVILSNLAARDGRKSLTSWGWALLDSKPLRLFAGLTDHVEPMAQPFVTEEDQDGNHHQMTMELPRSTQIGSTDWSDFATIWDRILFVIFTVVYAFVDMYFLI